MKNNISVLLYHQISDRLPPDSNPDCFCLKSKFIEQLNFIKEHDISVISLEDAELELNNPLNKPHHKSVVLTFDDADIGFYDIVMPILSDYGYTANLFVPSAFVGKKSEWSVHIGSHAPIMDKNQIREAYDQRIHIGSHSHSHSKMNKISPNNLYKEINTSKILLEDIISDAVNEFSYPHGVYNNDVINLLRSAGYKRAVTCNAEIYRNPRDNFEIPRNYITSEDSIIDFRAILLRE